MFLIKGNWIWAQWPTESGVLSGQNLTGNIWTGDPTSKKRTLHYCATQVEVSDLDEVEEAPGDDGVVVERHVEGHDGTADADAGHVGRDLVPDSDRALPESLSDGQLQVEDRNTLDEQHHEVRDQERSWTW